MQPHDAQVAVGRMFRAKERLAVFEPDIEPLTWPKVTHGEEAIRRVEARLGHDLPKGLRAYYAFFDRWDGFRFANTILGLDDLVTGPLHQEALMRRGWIEAPEEEELGHPREEWLVVGLNRADADLVLVHRSTGQTVWMVGGVVERYESFIEYLHHEAEIAEADAAEWEQGKRPAVH